MNNLITYPICLNAKIKNGIAQNNLNRMHFFFLHYHIAFSVTEDGWRKSNQWQIENNEVFTSAVPSKAHTVFISNAVVFKVNIILIVYTKIFLLTDVK